MRWWIATTFVGILALAGLVSAPVRAQSDGPQATIAALETRVAELEALADGGPTPTLAPPAATIVANPVPLLPGIDLLYYYFAPPADESSGPYVFGEIKNTTESALVSPAVRFVLFDDDRNVVGVVGGLPLFERIEPGEQMPFEGPFYPSDDPRRLGEWASEQVEICYGGEPVVSAENDATALELRDVEEVGKTNDTIRIEGQVFNGSDEPAEHVAVKAIFFDAQGRYSGSLADYQLGPEVPPGRSARFAIDHGFHVYHSFNPMDYAGSAHTYRLWVGIDSGVRMGCG